MRRDIRDWLFHRPDVVKRRFAHLIFIALPVLIKPMPVGVLCQLFDDRHEPSSPIHLGFRSGHHALVQYLGQLEEIGVNHIALNLRFSSKPIESMLDQLAEHVLPTFN